MGPYNRPEDEEVMNLVHLYGARINTKKLACTIVLNSLTRIRQLFVHTYL